MKTMKIAEILRMAKEKNVTMQFRFSVPGEVVQETVTGRVNAPRIQQLAESHRDTTWYVREAPIGPRLSIILATDCDCEF